MSGCNAAKGGFNKVIEMIPGHGLSAGADGGVKFFTIGGGSTTPAFRADSAPSEAAGTLAARSAVF